MNDNNGYKDYRGPAGYTAPPNGYTAPVAEAPHGYIAPPPKPICDARGVKRNPNILITFFLSCIPGAQFMYMGLLKKGAMYLTLTMLSIFGIVMMAESGGNSVLVFPFIIAVSLCGLISFFDGLRTRRLIRSGVEVTDSIDSMLGFIARNKSRIFLIAAIVFGVAAIGTILPWGFFRPIMNILRIAALFFCGYICLQPMLAKYKTKETSATQNNQI